MCTCIRINIVNSAHARNDVLVSRTSQTALAKKFTLIVSKTTDKCREKYYSSASKKCEKSSIQPNDLQSYDKSTQYAVITHLKFSSSNKLPPAIKSKMIIPSQYSGNLGQNQPCSLLLYTENDVW